MILTSPETLPVTIPETIPKSNQTTENTQLAENKIILGGIRNEEKMLAAVLAGTMVMSLEQTFAGLMERRPRSL